MKKRFARLGMAAITAGSAAIVMGAAPAVATGPEGAVVTPAAHVCSGTGNQGAGGGCTYKSTVAGGYQGSGFTLVATHLSGTVTVTDVNVNCAVGTPCTTGQATPIPALDTVVVTSTGGAVAAGTATDGPNPSAP
jgi:hypothetical protein